MSDIEQVQIFPTRQRITLNDKATKLLFNLSPEWFSKMINDGKKQGVVEKRNHKKHGKIKSAFSLSNEEGYTQILPLDEYDRAIYDVFISEFENGNRVLTLSMIQRALSGKIGEIGVIPYKDQRTAILESIGKLRHTDYNADILDAYQKLGYIDKDEENEGEGEEKIKKAPVLATKQTEKIINGQKTDIFYILDEPPLLTNAKRKKQILTYDAELLDVPDQNNTKLIVMLKNYSLRRVLECIKHHKQLKPILTLEDIFSKCRIADKPNVIKLRAREYLDKFFKHLESKGVIKSFEFVKKGNKFHAVKFTF